MGQPHSGRPLKTVETAMAVVDIVHENDGATTSEIADALGYARSTIHGYVKTLERADYLVEEDGQFHLGMEFLRKGGYVRIRKPAYHTIAPMVNLLASETGERAQFIVEEHGVGTYVHTDTGDNAVKGDAYVGKRVALHASAAGKAILSHLSDERVDEIVERRGLSAFTEQTITDRSRLKAELETVRQRGYSVSDQEAIPGLRAVGAPVVADDELFGGISVSGPAHRIKDDRFHDEFLELLLGTTNELQLRLEYE